jgi:hypothetical protein
MNTNDQWFEPGDKVVRVTTVAKSLPGVKWKPLPGGPWAPYGRVMCVSACWNDGKRNRVYFVGVPEAHGFLAACFRKVEEIKLCVRAAEKFSQPQTEDQPA